VVRPGYFASGAGDPLATHHDGKYKRENAHMYSDQIRPILAAHARLLVDPSQLDEDSDLYEAGLTSLSTVNLMLALEEHFNVEFLDRMLGRKTFQTIGSLCAAIAELTAMAPPGAAKAPEAMRPQP
jgi:acyl carrier protein